jgi:hypothetical protein
MRAFTVKHSCKDRYHKFHPELLDRKLFAWHKPIDATCEEYTMAYPLKARVVKPAKTAVARGQHGNMR